MSKKAKKTASRWLGHELDDDETTRILALSDEEASQELDLFFPQKEAV